MPRANGLIASIGTTARVPRETRLGPRPPSRSRSWPYGGSWSEPATWGSMVPRSSIRSSRPARSGGCRRCEPSAGSSVAAVSWTGRSTSAARLPGPVGICPRWPRTVRNWTASTWSRGWSSRGGPQVEVLNGVSLHGGLAVSWPHEASITAKVVVGWLIEHWKEVGLPGYAQFDNDTIFQGPHAHPDTIGRVTRLCLSLGVVPVFVPPRAPGFQAIIEGFNGTWQAKVWARFAHASLSDLEGRSSRFVDAHRRYRADRIEAAPRRRPFPTRWRLNLQARPRGRIVFLRRTDASGKVAMLGRVFDVDEHWLSRPVRAEVDLDRGLIRFHRLRRREPSEQPLIKQTAYRFPGKKFHD